MLVWAYDFDLETGNVSNKRTLVDCRSSLGEPDGMVVEYVCYPVHFHIDESILTDIQQQRKPLDCHVRLKPRHGVQPRGPTLEGYHLLCSQSHVYDLGWEGFRYPLRGQWEG